TGFRNDWSCTDETAILGIIIEQSTEWNSSLYINFTDYENALDSVDRRASWKLLRRYGVPAKIVYIIRNSHHRLHCKVVHEGQLRTGIMKTSTSEGKHEIQWRARNQPDDLDFEDDLALLSHKHEQMQMKTTSVAAASVSEASTYSSEEAISSSQSVSYNVGPGTYMHRSKLPHFISSNTAQRTPTKSYLMEKL
ncbi:unnamed protein product, partial [Schistosoma curassoni]|uniref:Anti_prolifrtn domain-containing protein n=1 Tax=Schistosoma curassoni TaxID=6186 RepID=A0A183KR17_9TREM